MKKNDNKKVTEAYKNRNKPRGRSRFKQGYFVPTNPHKYQGDVGSIIYRSSWEHKFCTYCDKSPTVVNWASEPFHIIYFNPITKKPARYYIDFVMVVIKYKKTGEPYHQSILVEVKPKAKLKKPKFTGNKTAKKLKQFERDVKEYLVNEAKFTAAREYCANFGHTFQIITEDFF